MRIAELKSTITTAIESRTFEAGHLFKISADRHYVESLETGEGFFCGDMNRYFRRVALWRAMTTAQTFEPATRKWATDRIFGCLQHGDE